MHAKHTIIRLHYSCRDLRARPNGEGQLGLLAVIHRQTLEQQAPETRPGATSTGVEHQEPLQSSAVVGQLSNSVQHQIDDLLADGVVATSKVVGGILLAGDQLLRVKQLSVSPSSHFVHHSRLQVHEHTSGHVLPGPGLRKEGVERVVTAPNGLVRRHLTIRLNTMLQAVQLPARVPSLDTALSDVNADHFAHGSLLAFTEKKRERKTRLP
mmetsp:Transcript_49324/g.107639  ORF Transcript_49324/g.107639 Transcript_49324/m.107639 type:complete len:211 (+) Transcript_49324:384-1016(+)